MIKNLIYANQFDQAYLPKVKDKLFFEGENSERAILNYGVLLTLATVIATYGVISGSAATVIGAMIISPLMTPIMAVTLAIVLGDSKRTSHSIVIFLLSICYVILLSLILSIWVSPLTIHFLENPEIFSRTAPDMFALYVALASGVVGAFVISRENISDTLSGVAIAISLVPPLSVIGISLSKGQWDDATGASLLFFTNFFAILVAGGATFLLIGVKPGWMNQEQSKRRKEAFIIAVICTALIAVPLFISGYDTLEQNKKNKQALEISKSWISGTPYRITDFSLREQNLTLQISGSGEVPSLEKLHLSLISGLEMPIHLQVRTIPEEILVYPPRGSKS